MQRAGYNAESLSQGLREFEIAFGMTSAEFYERHLALDPEMPIPRYERHVWASFYEDVQRLATDDKVMDRVSRSFVVA